MGNNLDGGAGLRSGRRTRVAIRLTKWLASDAVASSPSPQSRSDMMFIASCFIPHVTLPEGAYTDFKRPQDGASVGRIAEAGDAGVDAAVTSASATFRLHRKTPLATRVGWLEAAAEALRKSANEIADLISEDVGKPIRMARFEANRGIDFIEACAAAVPQLKGEVLALDSVAAGAGPIGVTPRGPPGGVARVPPFHTPGQLPRPEGPSPAAGGNAHA